MNKVKQRLEPLRLANGTVYTRAVRAYEQCTGIGKDHDHQAKCTVKFTAQYK